MFVSERPRLKPLSTQRSEEFLLFRGFTLYVSYPRRDRLGDGEYYRSVDHAVRPLDESRAAIGRA
jgi:hypothetical protein